MNQDHPDNMKRIHFGAMKRKTVSVSPENFVSVAPLSSDNLLPVLIQPTVDNFDLVSWAKQNKGTIQNYTEKHGGVLFRGCNISTTEAFEELVKVVSEDTLSYLERSSPRSQVYGNIYTSTEHPADQSIFLHNEQSYNLVWPLKISFFCAVPATQGGETPIADCRRVLRRIDPQIRKRFEEKQYMYVRNFRHGLGLSWQTAFQTTDKHVVEDYCHKNAIEFEWKDASHLRTRQVRPAIIRHVSTQEPVWFNHLTFFHVSTLAPSTQEQLLGEMKEEDLPNNTYYGDGTPIEASILDELREAYLQEMITFPWQKGDVLMLDNVLSAHGRAPYRGSRKVLVAMAEPHKHEIREQ